MYIKELIDDKTYTVHTILPDQTVQDAARYMADHGISALIVMDAQRPAGIFTEHDVFRSCTKSETSDSLQARIGDAMNHKLVSASPDDEIASTIRMMIKAKIGHIPVIKNSKVITVFTMAELAGHEVDALTAEIHSLKDYIADLQNAYQD